MAIVGYIITNCINIIYIIIDIYSSIEYFLGDAECGMGRCFETVICHLSLNHLTTNEPIANQHSDLGQRNRIGDEP